ncbi:MAG: single-stranded-DNA-specific exonuclease RecJ, partial [Firmicutes bacterium]|nr:single-stranded-DNA-specific exonuclease RecJ [Bacillota bacterium]
PEKIEKFLKVSSADLNDTSLIPDFQKGLEITKSFIESGENIYIYGDYDADGVMSTTVLYKALSALGANVCYYVPHRVYDGYGLNAAAVERIAESGCKLLITCDNGIAALDEVRLAKERGLKVVILDHHEPVIRDEKELLPEADAVIDCKRGDSSFPFREMCAGGLCYRFAEALFELMEQKFTLNRELITFAGIATVCDIVPLTDDNRIFVKNALYLLNNGIRNKGLAFLAAMTVQKGKQITPYTIGFVIGPCINAVGRLEAASEAVELFVTDDLSKASTLAARLVQKNKERQDITQQAADRLTQNIDAFLPVQVLYDPDIHESVAGIIASRIKEKYCRPTLVITNGSEGCKGSGRSIEEYDLHKNLTQFAELFTKFGGHAMACGFSLPYENIDKLRKALNDACTLRPEELTPAVKLDCMVPADDLTLELAKELEVLEPYGKGNEKPHFFTLAARLCYARLVGAEKTIAQLWFTDKSGRKIKAVFFGGAERVKQLFEENGMSRLIPRLESGTGIDTDIETDIAYSVDTDTYGNTENIQLIIDDIR